MNAALLAYTNALNDVSIFQAVTCVLVTGVLCQEIRTAKLVRVCVHTYTIFNHSYCTRQYSPARKNLHKLGTYTLQWYILIRIFSAGYPSKVFISRFILYPLRNILSLFASHPLSWMIEKYCMHHCDRLGLQE